MGYSSPALVGEVITIGYLESNTSQTIVCMHNGEWNLSKTVTTDIIGKSVTPKAIIQYMQSSSTCTFIVHIVSWPLYSSEERGKGGLVTPAMHTEQVHQTKECGMTNKIASYDCRF